VNAGGGDAPTRCKLKEGAFKKVLAEGRKESSQGKMGWDILACEDVQGRVGRGYLSPPSPRHHTLRGGAHI